MILRLNIFAALRDTPRWSHYLISRSGQACHLHPFLQDIRLFRRGLACQMDPFPLDTRLFRCVQACQVDPFLLDTRLSLDIHVDHVRNIS